MTIDEDPEGESRGDTFLSTLLAEEPDAGFVLLVREYEHLLRTVAGRVCGLRSDADDLCAEAFTRAYRSLRTYPPERIRALQLKAWLVTIVLNVWRNSVREATRRPQGVPLGEMNEPRATDRGPEEWAERNEGVRELAGMVGRLSDDQRTAVVLRHVCELSIGEIAEVLACPAGTAKSHVSRGLQQLREMYAEHDGAQLKLEQRAAMKSGRNGASPASAFKQGEHKPFGAPMPVPLRRTRSKSAP